MNFRTLDLNLLRVFDEVMAERNLTRAAQNLAMTQPAVSNALRRLAMKSVAAASTMTPVTQILAACAMSAVIVVALWQSTTAGTSVGAFASF